MRLGDSSGKHLGINFLSGRWWNPGQNDSEGGSHLQEGFQVSRCRFSDAISRWQKPRSCHDPGLETRNSSPTTKNDRDDQQRNPSIPREMSWSWILTNNTLNYFGLETSEEAWRKSREVINRGLDANSILSSAGKAWHRTENLEKALNYL